MSVGNFGLHIGRFVTKDRLVGSIGFSPPERVESARYFGMRNITLWGGGKHNYGNL